MNITSNELDQVGKRSATLSAFYDFFSKMNNYKCKLFIDSLKSFIDSILINDETMKIFLEKLTLYTTCIPGGKTLNDSPYIIIPERNNELFASIEQDINILIQNPQIDDFLSRYIGESSGTFIELNLNLNGINIVKKEV
jgi:hypothetical protein